MLATMQRQPLPPFVQAPDRSKPIMSSPPRLPSQFKRDAEQVVVQAAKEYVAAQIKPDLTATEAGEVRGRLIDSVRILKTIEGDPT